MTDGTQSKLEEKEEGQANVAMADARKLVEDKMVDEEERPYRVLEFYCGIGGLRYSLEKSGVKALVVEAFDINEVGNDVYEYNFAHRPTQGNVQGLSSQQLDNYRADAWLMSPPCQPYTRQGLQRDVDDPRAGSFLKMLQLLPRMTYPPTHVLVENVVGFENSITHSRLMAVMANAGLVTQEFILTPLQFGIPYSRPRYFCLAKSSSLSFVSNEYNGQLLCQPGPLLQATEPASYDSPAFGQCNNSYTSGEPRCQNGNAMGSNSEDNCGSAQPKRHEPYLDQSVECRSVGEYLELNSTLREDSVDVQFVGCTSRGLPPENEIGVHCRDQDSRQSMEESTSEDGLAGRRACRVSTLDSWEIYRVPMSVVDRWVDAYDIVTPLSTRCCCFTKSYSRYAKGAGSFLATNYPHADESGSQDSLATHVATLRREGRSLSSLGLRYFTPREVANLHSFPEHFTFPPHVRLKQRYALLGNSLSVEVVSSLIKYLFSLPNFGISQ